MATPVNDNFRRFDLKFENDIFNKTDYYYTNGLIMGYSSPAFSKSPFFRIFSKPDLRNYDRYGIQFEQKFFTPIDKKSDEILTEDRPYSSYFLVSAFKETRNSIKKNSTTLRLGVGMMGKYTGGKQLQSIIHTITPSIIPNGWKYQLRSDILIDLNYSYSGELYHSRYSDVRIIGRAQLGTLMDNLGIGSHIRIGWMNDYYTNMSDNLLAGKFQLYLDMNISSTFVVYNSLLQGGHFLDNLSDFRISGSEVNRLLYSATLLLKFKYQNFGLGVEQAFLSKEFNIGLPHSYGGVIFSVDF